MKGLAWLLALFAAAVGLSLAARFNDGYALLVVPPWRVEISLNLFLLLSVAGFALSYLILRTFFLTVTLPRRVREYRARRQRERATTVLFDALRLLFEGRYGQALKRATEAHAAGTAPGLAGLVAARAAFRIRQPIKRDAWLDRACLDDPQVLSARLMLEAEMLIDSRHFNEAAAALKRLQETAGRHLGALRLELKAQVGCGNWDEVLRIARLLEKREAMPVEEAREIKRRAHLENLRRRRADADALLGYLKGIPTAESTPRQAALAARELLRLEASDDAVKLLEGALDREWDSELVAIYGECAGSEPTAQIAAADRWLKQHPDDADLLIALGRLCLRQRLWGKAQTYLEASLSVHETRDAHLELARLFDQIGRTDEANRHYRESAKPGVRCA